MNRIRLLRIVLPILLGALVVGTVLVLRSHPERVKVAPDVSQDQASRMEGFRFSDLAGGRRRLLLQARVGRVDEKGAFEVEDVERIEVDREQQTPLVLTAKHGTGSGAQNQRVIDLNGGVTLDDGTGLTLEIPGTHVDQVKGLVQSVGVVKLHQKDWGGTAESVVYDLNGAPTRIEGLVLDGPDGGHVAADHGDVPPGSRTLTLTGNVEARQGGMTLHAGSVLVSRNAEGHLDRVTASPQVTGSAVLGGGAASLSAELAEASWDAAGKPSRFRLSGKASVQDPRGKLTADRIEGVADAVPGSYVIDADTAVAASATTAKGSGVLTCDALHATLDAHGVARDGWARGNVRFDGPGAAGEAAEARFTSLEADGAVTLIASPERRARLASGRMRIVAESIVSDIRGVKLHAEGNVESLLLPAEGTRTAAASPMFSGGEAVHFVSMTLDSTASGSHLVFGGDVRGWQEDRTLFADEVEMIQADQVLNARGRVSTRMPREAVRATSDADYVQVTSDRLAYRGAAGSAEYVGTVKVRQAEGWLETPRLVAALATGGPRIREIEASEGVKFEYRSPGENGIPSTATGDGDRAVYDAGARVLRVYGDKAPASVRSTGPRGGTTVGRVLRYDLATGALEVESGERDRATIRTPKG